MEGIPWAIAHTRFESWRTSESPNNYLKLFGAKTYGEKYLGYSLKHGSGPGVLVVHQSKKLRRGIPGVLAHTRFESWSARGPSSNHLKLFGAKNYGGKYLEY
ncbi:hypothetical protein KQX54_013082 [Cotesia glomerata]|uniref:Uncharacterized protein n=1 Tax=Cotesia glomerata TaxID=32391 RepID=A0AAV7I2R6_COTGL|nr:hypothetical protein KQX54_013082 [Cotesia glomerata]